MQGNQAHEDFDYPVVEWQYYLLAKKFGWTPTQVDEQPAYLVDWLMAIAATDDAVSAERVN
jgi:hypothetical protein